jgi:PhnB protein
MQAANPYLIFDGNTLEAFEHYRSVFGGEFEILVRMKDMGGGPPGATADVLDRIAHVALKIGQSILMGSDTMPPMSADHRVGNNVSIALSPDSAEEADRVFAGLSQGGTVFMEPQRTEWAEKYSSFVDRFGVHWMISYAGNVQFQPGKS